ncbi:MAG: hypothetical protein MJ252_11460 [archaeon]|nr:hypothetical protein [archaeon]
MSPTQQENPPYAECYSCEIDDEGKNIVAGYSNGYVNVFNIADKSKRAITFQASEFPITSVKWNKHLKTTFITASSDGTICHWHSASGKILHKIVERGNNINVVDYTNDYKKFATGGSDVIIRVYDEGMKAKICEMKPAKFEQPGHTSRIFAIKFNPDNSNMVISGGWDKTIQIYDVREGQIVNSIYGPKICGESLDIDGYYFLSGSWGQENQISIYDYRMLKCIYNVKWDNGNDYYPTYIYTARFDDIRENRLFAVGGVNENMYRLFDWNGFSANTVLQNKNITEDEGEEEPSSLKTEESVNNKRNLPYPLYGPKEFKSAVYSINFLKLSNKKEYMACGCGDGGVRLFTVEKNY